MTLIRHPQIECEGPDCRVRIEVPSECEAEQEAFLPPGWVRLIHARKEDSTSWSDEDFHTEACLFAALAKRHGTGAVALELDLQRKAVAEVHTSHEDTVHTPPLGSEAQRKMDQQYPHDHQFNGDPGDPLFCSVCGTDHMG